MKLISKSFKEVLFVGMVLCVFSACSEDELSEREEVLSKEYELVDIVWGKMTEDETTCNTFDNIQEVKGDPNGTKYSVFIFPLEKYSQSSRFFTDDPELFMHLAGTNPPMLSIPAEDSSLSTDITWHLTSTVRVPLGLETYNFPPNSYSTHQLEVEEPFTIQCTSVIDEYHVTATYRANFKEVNGNGNVEIGGKWEGIYYRCRDSKLIHLPF